MQLSVPPIACRHAVPNPPSPRVPAVDMRRATPMDTHCAGAMAWRATTHQARARQLPRRPRRPLRRTRRRRRRRGGGRHVSRGRQRWPRVQERGGGGNGQGCHHEGRQLAVGRLRRRGEDDRGGGGGGAIGAVGEERRRGGPCRTARLRRAASGVVAVVPSVCWAVCDTLFAACISIARRLPDWSTSLSDYN